MNEFALMLMGEVEQIITTSKQRDELAQMYPGYTVTPVSAVPLATLERYEFWGKRP